VTLAAEFAPTAAESAAIHHAIDRANDAAMRYIARELGWARKGAGGEEGADPGAVGWVSFRHHVARPTLPIQDGPGGATYLADVPVDGDPHAHIHNAMFNMVATESGRIGSLDTQRLHARVHEFGAYFQARLADELRRLGIDIGYNADEQAVVVKAVPRTANDAFSKSTRQVLGNARAFARDQGLKWDELSAERKIGILSEAGVAARLAKHGHKTDREIWRAQAERIGWQHESVIGKVRAPELSDEARFEQAYRFAARHLAREFRTAAVIDQEKLRTYAARGLIGTGIAGGIDDIDRVVETIEARGIRIGAEHAALVIGRVDGVVRVTNTVQIRIEQDLARHARRAALDRSGALPVASIRAAVETSGLGRLGEREHWEAQRAAIHALGEGGALTLLTGVAGSGKTTLLRPLVRAWREDTRFDAGGREVVGLALAWRQADALKEAGIERGYALSTMFEAIESGKFAPTRNTVLVIDEVSQIGPRSMLRLLRLQAETGMTIKALGDREQVQAIEAGDSIETMRRVLPKSALPELLSTVRQDRERDRKVANLFREGKAKEALDLKRADETAMLVGGDYEQVVRQIADLYIERRDYLRIAGSKRGITISTLTNEDGAEISRAIRSRLRARGEISATETVYEAIDQRGVTYDLPIAEGDSLRLFRKTWARIDGKDGSIGSNGDIVTVLGQSGRGLIVRNRDGQVGEVEWRRMLDKDTGRLLLGFGHALTVDAAQGITSGEHIDALPRGTAGVTAFKGYVAESRSTGTTWTVISEAAVHEAEKRGRALGDARPIATEDLWSRVAADMSAKPYKALGIDLLKAARREREAAVAAFIDGSCRLEAAALAGRDLGREARSRIEAEAMKRRTERHIPALEAALARNAVELQAAAAEIDAQLAGVGTDAEAARLRFEAAAAARSSSPGPG
jgi:hypothetical protein